jgi:ubiquinone/menaquinone biosynthesis C-methylase UbiE
MTIDHKAIYNTETVSRDYASREYIEPAEKTFLDEYSPVLKEMNMLDMGVGGGRTTKYFAPVVKKYTGADYAPAMIEACRKRYRNKYEFLEADARNMAEFNDSIFDFVLFSFNGIDSFSQRDRFSALREINRVLKINGIFFFSSHNLEWTELVDRFRIRQNRNKNRFTQQALKNIRLNLQNKSLNMANYIDKLRKNSKGHIYDNSLDGKAKVYYITPSEQISQLAQCGFKDIETYSLNGVKTGDKDILNTGGWVYYLCRAIK